MNDSTTLVLLAAVAYLYMQGQDEQGDRYRYGGHEYPYDPGRGSDARDLVDRATGLVEQIVDWFSRADEPVPVIYVPGESRSSGAVDIPDEGGFSVPYEGS